MHVLWQMIFQVQLIMTDRCKNSLLCTEVIFLPFFGMLKYWWVFIDTKSQKPGKKAWAKSNIVKGPRFKKKQKPFLHVPLAREVTSTWAIGIFYTTLNTSSEVVLPWINTTVWEARFLHNVILNGEMRDRKGEIVCILKMRKREKQSMIHRFRKFQ